MDNPGNHGCLSLQPAFNGFTPSPPLDGATRPGGNAIEADAVERERPSVNGRAVEHAR
jgi:hypothetical protein